jgi:hypothetical protein
MKIAELRTGAQTVENTGILRSFLPLRSAGSKPQHCYTFEYFAPPPGVIHTTCYYHYKRTRLSLKEETKWS